MKRLPRLTRFWALLNLPNNHKPYSFLQKSCCRYFTGSSFFYYFILIYAAVSTSGGKGSSGITSPPPLSTEETGGDTGTSGAEELCGLDEDGVDGTGSDTSGGTGSEDAFDCEEVPFSLELGSICDSTPDGIEASDVTGGLLSTAGILPRSYHPVLVGTPTSAPANSPVSVR